MTPKFPLKSNIQTEFPYETQIIDADNNVVFELKFEEFGTSCEETDFLESVIETLNNNDL